MVFYIVQSVIEVKRNIIGSLTRARRTGLVRVYDIHIRVERAAFCGTRSFLWEISNNPGHICRLSRYPSLSPQ